MNIVNIILPIVCTAIATVDSKYMELSWQRGEWIIKPRVIGGEDAREGQFPYQASLQQRAKMNHFCGASIISNRFLLTAAHCVGEVSPEMWVAVVGSVHISQGGIILNIDKRIQHNKWDVNRLVNDIALLRTAEEIIFSDTVQPIALSSQNLPVEGNTQVILSGWGDISNNVRRTNH